MNEFYPPIKPFKTEMLKVSELHTIYVEQAGNPKGTPVVFLHGGPGGGLDADYRRFFDPQFYRIILFDQRGAGQSTPSAELTDNGTWELVSDIEQIRDHLAIKNWLVFGGSWGSTLALAYAIKHPDRVTGLLLRGIFLCRPSEIQWFYQEGASQLFPDIWEEFLKPIPQNERHDLVTAYYKRLCGTDPKQQLECAKAWSKWEAATSRLLPKANAVAAFDDEKLALAFARIECHYFVNNAFFRTNNFLLENAAKISHIPCRIIQGRYDVVCPAKSAWELHKALPNSELRIVADAGHSATEPGIRSELVQATEDFKKYFL
jgi:proline iminopeptidase